MNLLKVWVGEVAREAAKSAVREALAELPGHVSGPLLTTSEAAKYARVSVGSVRRWIRDGQLQATRVGKTLRVQRVELEALVAGEVKKPRRGTKPKKTATPEELALRTLGLD